MSALRQIIFLTKLSSAMGITMVLKMIVWLWCIMLSDKGSCNDPRFVILKNECTQNNNGASLSVHFNASQNIVIRINHNWQEQLLIFGAWRVLTMFNFTQMQRARLFKEGSWVYGQRRKGKTLKNLEDSKERYSLIDSPVVCHQYISYCEMCLVISDLLK